MGQNGLVTWILAVIGSLFVGVLAVRGFQHWAKKEWGALITHLAGGAVVAVMVFTPQQAVNILKFIGAKIATVFTG
ncbi:hypothetical protein [Streptomyces sp. NBC_01304]|uniref:hypothetical protein n=1 Tax=Streptomyces sp. NBC_01304 TaxID=2903818 RepID=UPI002E0DAA25|nr:hypothetical protein OG430_48455 [Streptomyces sp. NBC_01304]